MLRVLHKFITAIIAAMTIAVAAHAQYPGGEVVAMTDTITVEHPTYGRVCENDDYALFKQCLSALRGYDKESFVISAEVSTRPGKTLMLTEDIMRQFIVDPCSAKPDAAFALCAYAQMEHQFDISFAQRVEPRPIWDQMAINQTAANQAVISTFDRTQRLGHGNNVQIGTIGPNVRINGRVNIQTHVGDVTVVGKGGCVRVGTIGAAPCR